MCFIEIISVLFVCFVFVFLFCLWSIPLFQHWIIFRSRFPRSLLFVHCHCFSTIGKSYPIPYCYIVHKETVKYTGILVYPHKPMSRFPVQEGTQMPESNQDHCFIFHSCGHKYHQTVS